MSDDEAVGKSAESELVSYQVIPEKSEDDYYEFINLNCETEFFDVAKATTKKLWNGSDPWFGGNGRPNDEVLFLIPHRRFVLVYTFDRYGDYYGTKKRTKKRLLPAPPPLVRTTPPWLDRELSHEDVSCWFRLTQHVPPTWLEPVRRRNCSQDPSSRLNREWQPPSAGRPGPNPEPRSTSQSEGTAPPETAPTRTEGQSRHIEAMAPTHQQNKQGKSSDAPLPLDEIVIAEALAAKGYTLEAAFVRCFKNRRTTTWQEIVEGVCPGQERNWATVKTWVNRVKNALIELDPRCRLSFSTSQREYLVIKNGLPE